MSPAGEASNDNIVTHADMSCDAVIVQATAGSDEQEESHEEGEAGRAAEARFWVRFSQ